MSTTLKGEIKSYIEQVVQRELEKHMKLYSKEELLTKAEFLKAMEIIQQRFEAMDRRFEAVDKRFEAVDKRFEELIDSMNNRFEAVDKRFEELIDSMNKRFEAVDKRFEELIDSMNKRFEAVDKRFEAVDKRFEAVDKRFEAVIETMDRGFLTLKTSIDSLGGRSGIRLEKTILALMQKALVNRDIDINEIQWIELRDETGDVFTENYRTDVDVLLKDGFTFLMEVKYHPDNRDVFHFLKVAELYAKHYQYPNKLLLVALDIDPGTQAYAESQHIEVITGEYE